jgi:hypothetical protein
VLSLSYTRQTFSNPLSNFWNEANGSCPSEHCRSTAGQVRPMCPGAPALPVRIAPTRLQFMLAIPALDAPEHKTVRGSKVVACRRGSMIGWTSEHARCGRISRRPADCLAWAENNPQEQRPVAPSSRESHFTRHPVPEHKAARRVSCSPGSRQATNNLSLPSM